MVSPLKERLLQELQLRNYSPKTQMAYCSAVAGLSRYYQQSPEDLTNEQIKAYVLHLQEERGLAWSTCNQVICGLRFFYTMVLSEWDCTFDLPPRKSEHHLPEVLSKEELDLLFSCVTTLKQRLLLLTTYSAGLRVSEVVKLTIGDIDSQRMMIHIKQSKGKKDRCVPLSKRLLEELRLYWQVYRPESFLFYSNRGLSVSLSVSTVQKVYNDAKKRAGIKRGRGIHTLRHCYATHLLENGTDIRVIQRFLGHTSLATTAVYLKVTSTMVSKSSSPLDSYSFSAYQEQEQKHVPDDVYF